MAHLIDKDALVADIERRVKEYQSTGDDYWFPVIENLKNILSFLDDLEVKEVDLEKELDSMITPELKLHKALPSLFDVAKHFFELGLKAQKGE